MSVSMRVGRTVCAWWSVERGDRTHFFGGAALVFLIAPWAIATVGSRRVRGVEYAEV